MKVKSIAALLMAGALAITGVPGMPLLQAEVVKADEPTSESLAAPQIEVTKLTTDGRITGTITS